MFVSKGNGLNAEWGESPREPVTVKLQLREISQIRAWAWNKSDALSTVCFLPAGAPAGKSAFVGAVRCESRFYFFAKKITQSVPIHVNKTGNACGGKHRLPADGSSDGKWAQKKPPAQLPVDTKRHYFQMIMRRF